MTLPLVGWYISPEVIEYLQEFQFAILNFSFIPFREVGFIDDYIGNYKGLQQTNLNFETVGLESGSTLVNHFGAFLMILFIILMHLIFTLLKNTWLWKCKSKYADKLFNWIDEMFNFWAYLRITIEMYLFATLSCFSEVKKFSSDSLISSVSLACAFVFWLFAVFECLFVLYNFWKFRNFDISEAGIQTNSIAEQNSYQKVKELFNNIKNSKLGKLYNSIFLL